MKQLKKKKGFTLVELIVVIAIIAILAAIAVPTTMHFVEKANISKEAQQMNVSDTIQNIFIDTVNNPLDLASTTTDNSFKVIFESYLDSSVPADLGGIKIKLEKKSGEGAAQKFEVTYTIYGNKYGDKDGGTITGTLQGTYSFSQLFYKKTSSAAYENTVVKTTEYVYYNAKATTNVSSLADTAITLADK